MMLSRCCCSSSLISSPHSLSFIPKLNLSDSCTIKPSPSSLISVNSRFRASAADVLPADWHQSHKKSPLGPSLHFSAEEAIRQQLDALQCNDQPHQDYGIEIMYQFAGFDPLRRSTYFGPFFDLGQFERFRRAFHHSTYRVLLGHKERKILSSLFVEENRFKQRVWIRGCRPKEEETFQFTMIQKVGGLWDGYWLTESLLHDGEGEGEGEAFNGGSAY